MVCLLMVGCAAPDLEGKEQDRALKRMDATGIMVELNQKPRRIVSLNNATDEILFSLTSSDNILAVSENSINPNISFVVDNARLIKYHLPLRTNSEFIYTLQPDLVLFPETGPIELVESMRDMGIKVFVVPSATGVEAIEKKILDIACIIGEMEKGKQLVSTMTRQINELAPLRTIGKKQKTVVAFTFYGAYGSKGGLFDDLCRHAGVINGGATVGLEKGERLSQEQVLAIDPDAIFLPKWSHYKDNDPLKFKEQFLNDPAYGNLRAVKMGKVYLLDEKYRSCGSQYVVEGILELHRTVYQK